MFLDVLFSVMYNLLIIEFYKHWAVSLCFIASFAKEILLKKIPPPFLIFS